MLTPTFIAHRGYAAAYPENTLIALDAARKVGAEYVEVDVQLSADHIPVLFHDRDLKRLCQELGAVHEYSYQELQQFSVTDSEKFQDTYSNNKMTSLHDFVDYLKQHPQLQAFIELKRLMIDVFGEDLVIEKIMPLFQGMEEQISFISYNHKILKTIHETTDFKTGIVVDEWNEFNKNASWSSEWLFCSHQGLPEKSEMLKVQSKLAVFEVGNIGIAKHLLAKGIAYLETFCIKEMLEAFPNKNK